MHAYKYDSATREYLGTCPLVPNPRRPDAPCLPAFATDQPPSEAPAGHVACWSGSAWEIVEDHRGKIWYRPETREAVVISELGAVTEGLVAEMPPPSLNELRQAKLAAIHAEKCRARDSGFDVSGVLFDSDLAARTAYAELALALQQEPTLSTRWRASEGQWVTMDAALFADVHAAGRAHIEGCFAWQEARELEIAEAETLAELEAVSEVYAAPEA